MTEKLNIYEALSVVMGDVQSVRKDGRNTQQNFNFRGIDAVMNAVGPALRKHGCIVVPTDVHVISSEQYQSKQGATMTRVVIQILWRFIGPDGSSLDAMSLGEAADAGDKVVSKAHSVAYRTVLLQALCIPTDEPDPDASAHERAAAQQAQEPVEDSPASMRARIRQITQARGWSVPDVESDYALWATDADQSKGVVGLEIRSASLDDLHRYHAHLLRPITADAL